MRKMPVYLKNTAKLMRTAPKYRNTVSTAATTMPSRRPSSGHRLPLVFSAYPTMSSAVSTPSRPTAKNESVSTAAGPTVSAFSMFARSSPEMFLAAVRIHRTMAVTMTTATSEAAPAMISAVSPVTVDVP
jgi:hypothetical protein